MTKLQAERTPRSMFLLIALAALFFISPAVFAQTDTGRIVGTVKDANAGLVLDASIMVRNERTGEERMNDALNVC